MRDARRRARAFRPRIVGGRVGRFARTVCARRLGCRRDATPAAIVAAACAFDGADACARAARCMIASAQQTRPRARRRRWRAGSRRRSRPRSTLFDAYCAVFFTKEGDERKDIVTKAIADGAPEIEAALRREAERLARRACAGAPRPRSCARPWRSPRWAARMLALYRAAQGRSARSSITTISCSRARDLLAPAGRSRPGCCSSSMAGIDHILIDEAQDTNPEQWEVVQTLADEFFAGEARAPGARTVFAVGDAKQSIFSFQRADPGAFLAHARRISPRAAQARRSGLAHRRARSSRSARPAPCWPRSMRCSRGPRRAAGVALDGAPIRHAPHRAGSGRPRRAVAAGRAGRSAAARAVGAADRAAPRARAAGCVSRTRSPRPSRAGSTHGERLPARDRPHPRRRRDGAGAPPHAVRRCELVRALKERDVAVAGADRMRARRSARGRGRDGAAAVPAAAGGRSHPRDRAQGAALRLRRGALCSRWRMAAATTRAVGRAAAPRRRASGLRARGRAAAASCLGRADFAPPYELFAEVLGARRRAAR